MRPPRWVLVTALLLALQAPASAIQLLWHDGSTNVNFSETTRCMLVVRAGPGESALPHE